MADLGLKKGFGNQDYLLNVDYFVNEDDLSSYVQYKYLLEHTDKYLVETITPFSVDDKYTVMYLVEYLGAWEILPADKRCSLILAQGEEHGFDWDIMIPPVKEYLTSLASQVLSMRMTDNVQLFDDENLLKDIEDNLFFWKMIRIDSSIFTMPDNSTRSGLEPPGEPEGLWEIVDAVRDTLFYDSKTHLIQTHWHQEDPYNSYCPYKSYSSTQRAPAGCVAIAGAQQAFYLHNKWGRPYYAPETAECLVHVPGSSTCYSASPSDPFFYTTDYSLTPWGQMETDDDVCAKLIAAIGIAVRMDYYNLHASAYLSWLKSLYFENNYLTCDFEDFNINTVYSNLSNEVPVICSANNTTGSGHCFIIDGYLRHQYRLTTTFQFVPFDGSPSDLERVEIVYYPPRVTSLCMNWGWIDNGDAFWFAPSAYWSAGGHTYLPEDRTVLCNFSVTN